MQRLSKSATGQGVFIYTTGAIILNRIFNSEKTQVFSSQRRNSKSQFPFRTIFVVATTKIVKEGVSG
jgi:hypothetical protein